MEEKICYFCKEPSSYIYKFKKDINNDAERNTLNNVINSINYCHFICPECLIRYIFVKYINIFSEPSENYNFYCSCKEGKLNLSYLQLIDVFQKRTIDNLKKKKEKKCKTHNKNYTKYCKNCNLDICEDCFTESYAEHLIHLNHHIEDKEILFKKLKKFFGVLNLRYYDFTTFMNNFNNICKKYKDNLEINYNDTLIFIDTIINDLIDFRAKLSVYYKEKVVMSVQTLKVLKMFYCNYYYDKKKAEKGNDFKIYKYLNQINYELDDILFIKDKESMKKLEQIKSNTDYLNDNINKILDINFSFKRVLDGFRKYQSILKCDNKPIKSIVKIDENRIISVGEYMQYLEEKNGEFVKISRIQTNHTITSILLFKNGNILTSFGKSGHFNIQEWGPNENYSNSKRYDDDFICNNKINKPDNKESFIGRTTTFEPSYLRLSSGNINTNNVYKKLNSFVSSHKDDINVMIEMNDSMFASGGNDKIIIIWQKDEEQNNYKIIQKINNNNGIKNMIFLYDKRFVSSDSYTFFIWKRKKKLDSNDYFYYIDDKSNISNGNINAIYQIRNGSIITGSNHSYFEVFNEIDGKYKSFQNINLKINSINCIAQLKDDRIIVASQKGLIKILSLEGNEYQINESITTIQGMPINCIKCFEDGSFILGQNVTLHVWKNNESI